ncbi:RNaseH domain-containing protein, partial [Streptosporangium sp. NPDC006013]|uniref:RNaseH domain-containing protein n=1 Tax=Streptosporangium sp. NPDC006013 TaxID=3155596 RepID=UPI0033BAB6CF
PVEPLRREKSSVYKGLTVAAKSVIPPEVLRAAIGSRLSVELFTESESTAQYALDRLGVLLGLKFPRAVELGEAETLIDLGPLSVGVRRMDPLSKFVDHAADRQRPKEAADAQVELIMSSLSQATLPTITLVEISESGRYAGNSRSAEVKSALRHRLLSTGRISRFVATEAQRQSNARQSNEREFYRARFSAAVDDLFRQLGVRQLALPLPAPKTLTCHPALLAIWMIQQDGRSSTGLQRQVPIAVLSDPTGQRVLVRTPKTDWKPIHLGLIEIYREHCSADLEYKTNDIYQFIKNVTEDAARTFPDVLLLTHAQNLRRAWKFLSNGNLGLDTIEFDADSRRPISTLSGLRHIRVRTADYNETPECYGINDEGVGQPTGLWRYPEELRLFASTSGKPATAASASISVSKLTSGIHNGSLIRLNPKAQVWNEQVVELLVAGLQSGDRPERWAALAHNLRGAEPYSHWMTPLPWPLSLAQRIEKYIF